MQIKHDQSVRRKEKFDLNSVFFSIVFDEPFSAHNVKYFGHVKVKIFCCNLPRSKNNTCNLIKMGNFASSDNHLSVEYQNVSIEN